MTNYRYFLLKWIRNKYNILAKRVSNTHGSVYVVILSTIALTSIITGTMVMMTTQSIMENRLVKSDSQALLNARTGINVALNDLSTQYNPIEQSVKNAWNAGTPADPSTIQSQILSILDSMSKSIHSVSGVYDYTIQYTQPTLGSAEFSIPITITANGYDGVVKKQLQQKLVLTSAIQSLAYTVYSPGNIFLNGGVSINGNIATNSNVYVSTYPWEGILNYGATNFTPLTSGAQNTTFYICNSTYYDSSGNIQKPMFTINSSLSATNIYTYTKYTDNNQYTTYFGQASMVSNSGLQLIQPSQLSVPFGSNPPRLSTTIPNLSSDYVSKVVQQGYSIVTKDVTSQYVFDDTNINNAKSYYSTTLLHTVYPLSVKTQPFNSPVYVDGNLTIGSNETFSVNGPVYINGNLTVSGTLKVNGSIYVSGNTYLQNITKSSDPNQRLQIWSRGSVVVDVVNTSGNGGIATSPINLRMFLASGQPMYLEGMEGYFTLTGGLTAPTVILNASYGKNLTYLDYTHTQLLNTNPSDLSPRLSIVYDGSLVADPMAGTPGMADLSLVQVAKPVAP
jgi:hypothetical protein